jgi:protein ImuB
MLWIGIHLPLLPLETAAATAAPGPLALHDGLSISHADAAAQALGIHAGLKRATALALLPQLVLAQADPQRDALALRAVAHAALTYTPAVCLAPPQTVLLEVHASLRCFGGFESLLQRLRATLAPLQHQLQLASAPTAQGAALLCRLARRRTAPADGVDAVGASGGAADIHCPDLASLTRRLEAAPVWLLGPGREHWEALQGMGLRHIGDLRGLPRGGLARRFGAALLNELDCALGQRPDPRVPVELPAQFASRLELLARADTTEQVLQGAQVLLARLVVWATAHQARIGRFRLEMLHEGRQRSEVATPPASQLLVALTEPSCDAAHLQLLLRERLAQVQLVAPTLELRLHCSELVHRPPPNGELFPTTQQDHEGLTRLLERLQARLGREQLQCLWSVADHRPERSSQVRPFEGGWSAAAPRGSAHAARPASGNVQQPVWLLPEPQPLGERERSPLLDGQPLQLLSGPERIESGWWDTELAERDYFIAQAADQSLVWIYRSRLPLRGLEEAHGWHLHGRFG